MLQKYEKFKNAPNNLPRFLQNIFSFSLQKKLKKKNMAAYAVGTPFAYPMT